MCDLRCQIKWRNFLSEHHRLPKPLETMHPILVAQPVVPWLVLVLQEEIDAQAYLAPISREAHIAAVSALHAQGHTRHVTFIFLYLNTMSHG